MKRQILFFLYVFLLGCEVSVMASPTRVVSLSPSLTLNLRNLNEENHIVGCTSYCKTTRNIPVVATAIKVNIEKVAALKPDLVLTTSLTPPETIATLRKLGLHVVIYPSPHSFQEICDQFIELGKLFNKQKTAESIIEQTKKKVEHLVRHKSVGKKVFIQLGTTPLFAVIPHTFMHDYIDFCGAQSITTAMKSGTITREAVLKSNPDVIIIVTMGVLANDEKSQWEKYKGMNAVKNGKIFIIKSEIACTPTPQNFVEALSIISKWIK